ncbi:nitroreductase family protein [bacterium]|nr:nitroreductase family protein [bacterium]
MDYKWLIELTKKRRSCRRFRQEPIPDELVDKIIEVARWAPSGANSQPWEFIILKRDELKEKIVSFFKDLAVLSHKAELTRKAPLRYPALTRPVGRYGYEDAPVFIILCGDMRTKQAYPLYAAAEGEQTTFDSSLASAFLYMHLAATTLGLGAQWVSVIRNWIVQCRVKELLRIPEELSIYDMMAVGYPASAPRPRMVRDMKEMTHLDYYDRSKFKTDEEVSNFIADNRKGRTYSGMGIGRSKEDRQPR